MVNVNYYKRGDLTILHYIVIFMKIGIRIGRFLVQTPLGAQPGLGTQPRYEAPSDLRVESVETQWLTSG